LQSPQSGRKKVAQGDKPWVEVAFPPKALKGRQKPPTLTGRSFSYSVFHVGGEIGPAHSFSSP